MVGVNKYQVQEPKRTMNTLYIDRAVERRQCEKLEALKRRRNAQGVENALRTVRDAAKANENLCGPTLEAVKAYCTLQEVCDSLRAVYGEYREAGSF